MHNPRSKRLRSWLFLAIFLSVSCAGITFIPTTGWPQLASLKTVPVPQPLNLLNFIKNRNAAVALGKALFWDMQVGSDGVQACASCHFHAGADNRTRNQLNPAILAGDALFGNNLLGLPFPTRAFGPNVNVTRFHFPFHRLVDPDLIGDPADPATVPNVVNDCNDVMSSMGVQLRQFADVVLGNPVDASAPLADPIFQISGINTRRVEPRNTPTVINAVFTFSNFWDGRANNIFNGNNPFGPADPGAHLFINRFGSLTPTVLRLRQSSLASQSVGPPLSDFEMSWRGRSWPKIGKKMMTLRPLAQQRVHPNDSVLGPLADNVSGTGLTTTYAAMIQAAFHNRFWNNATQHLEFVNPADPSQGLQIVAGPSDPNNTSQFNQMEANFSFFFGLAVQLYEATLIADSTPFDQFLEGAGAQTEQERRGQVTFEGAGRCTACHFGGELTGHATSVVQGVNPITEVPQPLGQNPLAATEFMGMFIGAALYDTGIYNIGVRPGGSTDPAAFEFVPTNEDVGRGENSPFVSDPVNQFPIPLSFSRLGMWRAGVLTPVPVPAFLARFIPSFPLGFRPGDTRPVPNRTDVFGNFKTPQLRNVELTGPYFHNGGLSTLHQVVEFYTRGGDFPVTNQNDLDPEILPIGKLIGSDTRKNEVVAFLLSLTDLRVKEQTVPFDHPELFIPNNGRAPVSPGSRAGFLADARFTQIPGVGVGGLPAEGLPPLTPFLNLNPFSAQ